MQHRPTLNIVKGHLLIVVHLLSTEDETLLRRWDALFFFDSFFDSCNGIVSFNVDFYFLSGECLNLDLRMCVCEREREKGWL